MVEPSRRRDSCLNKLLPSLFRQSSKRSSPADRDIPLGRSVPGQKETKTKNKLFSAPARPKFEDRMSTSACFDRLLGAVSFSQRAVSQLSCP